MILCEPGVTHPSWTSWSFALKVWVLIAKLRTLVTRLTPIDVSFRWQSRARRRISSGSLPTVAACARIPHGPTRCLWVEQLATIGAVRTLPSECRLILLLRAGGVDTVLPLEAPVN